MFCLFAYLCFYSLSPGSPVFREAVARPAQAVEVGEVLLAVPQEQLLVLLDGPLAHHKEARHVVDQRVQRRAVQLVPAVVVDEARVVAHPPRVHRHVPARAVEVVAQVVLQNQLVPLALLALRDQLAGVLPYYRV